MQLLVKALKAKTSQRAHKGHNRPAVNPGDSIFGIFNPTSRKYFHYGYLSQESANSALQTLRTSSMDFDTDIAYNYRSFPVVIVP